MVAQIVLTVALILGAAYANAMMDLISLSWWSSGWWSKTDSWFCKWKGGYNGRVSMTIKYTWHWWYLGLHRTEFPERFPFSSTALVFLTDGWHFFQWVYNRCWQGAILVWMWDGWGTLTFFIPLCILYSVAFESIYTRYKNS